LRHFGTKGDVRKSFIDRPLERALLWHDVRYIDYVRLDFYFTQDASEGRSCAYRAMPLGGEENRLKDGCYNVITFASYLTNIFVEVIVGSFIPVKVMGALPPTLHTECVK
jgi:hypothetical protein